MKQFILHFVADMLSLLSSFILVSSLYPGPIERVLEKYQSPFIFFTILFLIISFIFNKYEDGKRRSFLKMLNIYAKALFYTAAISALAIYLFQLSYYSRFVIFGTMLGIAMFEFLWILIYQAFHYSRDYFKHRNSE
jgi:hypothetical protein